MARDDRFAKLWWAVPAASFLILVALAMIFGKPPESPKNGTSYDASAKGFRAAYLLLERLHYPIARSRRATGGAARWVLFPTDDRDEASAPLDAWVRGGGILIFADDSENFARGLHMDLKVENEDAGPDEEPASGAGVARLMGGALRVEWPGHQGRVWATAGDRPVVTVYEHGKGEIWLINRPELLTNRLLSHADNAILLCRIADEILGKQPGKLEFDEYYHGMRDRPGVVALLVRPPTVWITIQGLLLIGLLLWHYVPRFGNLRTATTPRRRSKEEFLNAMASLLERKGDFRDAYSAARNNLAREMEQSMGLPAGAETMVIIQEASRRKSIDAELLHKVLTGESLPVGAGKVVFVRSLKQLETIRDEFFKGRHHR